MRSLVYFQCSSGSGKKLNKKAIDINHIKEEMDAIEYLFGKDDKFIWVPDRPMQEKCISEIKEHAYFDPTAFSWKFSQALTDAITKLGLESSSSTGKPIK